MMKTVLDSSDVRALASDLAAACQKAGFEAPAFKTVRMRLPMIPRIYEVVLFEGDNSNRAALWCAKWLTKRGVGNDIGFLGNGECAVSSWAQPTLQVVNGSGSGSRPVETSTKPKLRLIQCG